MPDDDFSRRDFLKQAGTLATAAAVVGKLSQPRAALAAEVADSAHAANRLSFGVQTPPQHVSYAQVRDLWLEADELGYDSAFGFDHFLPIFSDPTGPCLEGWTLLAALAVQTKRLKVGLLVTGNTYRNPAVVAKMAATVDHVSGGRLILGLGAGWFKLEHDAFGIPYYTPGGRARRLVEAVELIKALFTEDRTTYRGKYYQITDAPFEPKPLQKPYPPILIGGVGPKVVQPLVARHADIWHFFVREGGMPAAKKLVAHFDGVCAKVGRDPAEIQKSTSLSLDQLKLPADELRALIRTYADLGVRYFIVSMFPDYDAAALRRFATDVLPAFRET